MPRSVVELEFRGREKRPQQLPQAGFTGAGGEISGGLGQFGGVGLSAVHGAEGGCDRFPGFRQGDQSWEKRGAFRRDQAIEDGRVREEHRLLQGRVVFGSEQIGELLQKGPVEIVALKRGGRQTDGNAQGTVQLFGGKGAGRGVGESVGLRRGGVSAGLACRARIERVHAGEDDLADESADVMALRGEIGGEPVEEFGVAGRVL